MASCGGTLKCAAILHIAFAGTSCKPLIEKFTNYDFKWTNGWCPPAFFSGHSWFNKEDGSLLFSSNEVKFENGLGVWKRMGYACSHNTNATVAAVVSVWMQQPID